MATEQDGDNGGKMLVAFIGIGIIGIVIGIVISGMIDLSNNHFGNSFLKMGIGSFLLSLIIMSLFTYFSIPGKEAEKRKKSLLKLDRKEIRRSIAISFTILYILLISFYFREVESVTHVISAVNSTVNETVLNVTANSSFTTITILNKTTDLTGNGLTGEGLTHFSSIITAFTTVYLVIIGFYFGSRVYEKIKEIKDAEDALKIQYIMDEIEEDVFDKKMKKLRGRINSQLRINATESPSEITIEHRGGDDIDLKDTMIVIKMNEKETKIDPVARATNMFKVTHKMVIHMGKTNNGSGIEVTDITVTNKSYLFDIDAKLEEVLRELSENKNSENMEKLKNAFATKQSKLPDEAKVVKEKENNWEITNSTLTVKKEEDKLNVYTNSVFNKGDISNGITEWKEGKKVEVDMVYKPTKEIISPWESEIKKGKGVDP